MSYFMIITFLHHFVSRMLNTVHECLICRDKWWKEELCKNKKIMNEWMNDCLKEDVWSLQMSLWLKDMYYDERVGGQTYLA